MNDAAAAPHSREEVKTLAVWLAGGGILDSLEEVVLCVRYGEKKRVNSFRLYLYCYRASERASGGIASSSSLLLFA